ncbi:MAG TPA: DNA polymerase III subunit delta, partial [Gammaproteobacteria bacterium]|nr:DNA polymerase III subunit delta [Gammaproteobacteria bacterium]
CGDEPLQVTEAADAIRAAAREAGHGERQVFHVESGFDWDQLAAAADNLSLFAERRLLELRMPTGKPGDAGSKALTAYAANAPEDTVLLITAGRLDKRQQQSKWFKALESAGVVVQVWPVDAKALPGWVAERMRSRGLQPNQEAARLLAEKVEGNLLAAAQEVEKLALLYGEAEVDEAAVAAAVSDSSRYDVFELVDTALSGDAARVVRVVDGLRGEGTEPTLVLWALGREVRALAAMAAEVAGGAGPDAVMGKHQVWSRRKGPVGAALKRAGPNRWRGLLQRAARADRIIKGAEWGNAWEELLQLALLMAGARPFAGRRPQ